MAGNTLALLKTTSLLNSLHVGDDGDHLLKGVRLKPKLAEATQNVCCDGHAPRCSSMNCSRERRNADQLVTRLAKPSSQSKSRSY